MAAIIGGSIAALGSIGGALMGGKSAEKASRAQANVNQYMFERQQQLNAPYMYAGNTALNQLFGLSGINSGIPTAAGQQAGQVGQMTPEQQAASMQSFYSSPEYTLQKGALDQAQQRQAAAQGTAYSPSSALGSAEIAGKTFADWRNNLASLANIGTNAAGVQNTNLANYGSGQSAAAGNLGAARSNMYGAIGQSVADIGGQVGQYAAYQNQQQQNRDYLSNLYQPQATGGYQAPANYGIQPGTMPGFERIQF